MRFRTNYEQPAGDPAERLRALLEFTATAFGDARKRALATLILDAVPTVPPEARAGLEPDLAAASLPPAARATIVRALAAPA